MEDRDSTVDDFVCENITFRLKLQKKTECKHLRFHFRCRLVLYDSKTIKTLIIFLSILLVTWRATFATRPVRLKSSF